MNSRSICNEFLHLKRTDLREAILEAAQQLLVREGYGSLTMRHIAQRAGCSVGSLYLYLERKEGLLFALLDRAQERLAERFFAPEIQSITDPRQRLQALARAYVDFGLTHPEAYEVLFMLHPRELASYPEERLEQAYRLLDPIVEAIDTYVQQHQLEMPDVRVAAVAFWSALHGIVSLLLAGRLARLRLEVDRDALIEQAIRQAMGGLCQRMRPKNNRTA